MARHSADLIPEWVAFKGADVVATGSTSAELVAKLRVLGVRGAVVKHCGRDRREDWRP